MDTFKLDRTAVRRTTLWGATNDFAFWQTQSPLLRLKTVELLRKQFHRLNNDYREPRLQRVYRFAELK